MQFSLRALFLCAVYFIVSVINAQDSNSVNYSLFLEKSVSFGTVDTKVDEGIFKEGESFTIPEVTLPSSPIDFSLYQDLYNALTGGRFGIEYGALDNDIIMKIFIRNMKSKEGIYKNLGEDADTLFSYFEIRIWELPDSNFYPEDSSYYFNEGYHAIFSLPKSEELIKFLNITEIGTNDSLGFAFLENEFNEHKKVEDWNSKGIETIESLDSITFKSIHLSRIGGGRKRSLEASKSTVSSIKIDETNGTPLKFELYQNYPNPFNPTTNIKYCINKTSNSNSTVSYVNLRVYDVLGEEVKTLVNQNQVPGIYEVNFDASSLTSGIYYYRLKFENFIQTKKMIVIK